MGHNPVHMKRALPLVLILLADGTAWAHDEKLSLSRVEVKEDGIVWSVVVSMQGLEKVLQLPTDPIDLTERQLQEVKSDIVDYLRRCAAVEINGSVAEAEPGPLEPVYETFVASGDKYIAHARQELRFRSASPVKRAKLSGAFFATVTPRHNALLNVSWNGAQRSFSRFGAFDLEITPSRIHPTFVSTVGEFLVPGLRALLLGLRPCAFLLALLLWARKPGETLRVIASFAAASSLTLLLGTLEVVRLPTAATEILIAASIVYVGAENYFLKDGRHRWVLTFAFGLVHGLRFSSLLSERFEDVTEKGLPVASFGLGLLLGELALLLVALPLLTWIRKAPDETTAARRQSWLVRIGSLPLVLGGLALLAGRLFRDS
jgi:hypothetical protein